MPVLSSSTIYPLILPDYTSGYPHPTDSITDIAEEKVK
jgi:hypothetical protein